MGKAREKREVYSLGQEVSGTVVKVLPYGVFVSLEDGVEAYIRRRDMSWEEDTDPRELVHVGDVIQGSVTDLGGRDRCLELSHKATLPDPWDAFIARYGEGDVVQGTAKKLTSFGTFIEILPGVNGLVPMNALVPWSVEEPEDVIWAGDDVEAVITSIDLRSREVELSICARLRQRQRVAEIWEKLYSSPDPIQPMEEAGDGGRPDVEGDDAPTSIESSVVERIGPVLVVEDDDQVRIPLTEWFRKLGSPAHAAVDVEEAEEKLGERSYGLLLVDIHLPDKDGLALLRQLRVRGEEDVPVAVMSTPDCIEGCGAEIEELNVLEVFAKPLVPERLEWFMAKLSSGEPMPVWRAPSERRADDEGRLKHLSDEGISRPTPLRDRLLTILDRLVADTEADTGALFRLDPDSQRISAIALSGAAPEMSGAEAEYYLGESPVKDVLLEGDPVLEHRMTGGVERRFQKLLELISFQSCVGVPVWVEDGTDYAVFLFGAREHAFTIQHLTDAQTASVLIAAVVERQSLNRQVQSYGSLLTSGQLMAGLGHELYNKVSGLEIQLRNLHSDWQVLEVAGSDCMESPPLRDVGEAVTTLVKAAGELRHTTEVFQRLMRAKGGETLDVNNVVRGCKMLLRPLSRRAGVRIETKLDPDLPRARGSEARLQQVFLNLMLNGVQQMKLIERRGLLRVTTTLERHGDGRPIKIRFSDYGPGIHTQLQEKIFNLGFSTRPGGTGLGLFIARSLLDSMGGIVTLEESFVPLGATFLVELPLSGPTTHP